jgi:murein DD-endopeptidase MepM/ murein hydrolase activator NlpD
VLSINRDALLYRTLFTLMASLALQWQRSPAEELYKYRDANGNLVYSDHKPDTSATTPVDSIAVTAERKAPRIDVQAVNDGAKWALLATNECQCVVEFSAQLIESRNLKLANGTSFHKILPPQSQQALVEVPHTAADGAVGVHLIWKTTLGAPGAEHHPPMPYRAPFSVGASYRISQAYPILTTHASRADQYAVDIALPDGTPIYAARDGTVINVKHDKFLTAATPIMLDQANMVEILHDDGTMALYAHLHWDSVRVQAGQHVRRGDYIADSGNTGYTTGPHLHFAVFRNAGNTSESLPIQFAGPGGSPVTPQPNAMLTAY